MHKHIKCYAYVIDMNMTNSLIDEIVKKIINKCALPYYDFVFSISIKEVQITNISIR